VDGSVVRVGVLGCGTVGASLVALVHRQNATIHARTGLSLEISRIAVRDLSRSRPINVENAVFTSDAMAVATDPSIDVIVEVMGVQLVLTKKSTMPEKTITELIDRCRATGLRRTKALEQLLVTLLEHARPMTLNELAQSERLTDQCDKATVFRLLQRLTTI
jgi:hypothetical protein